jgi:hypothetical protein
MRDTCFVTPTYRGDLERFVLLRDSIVAFGQGDVPHYALINTEDVELLESLRLRSVIPIPSADLLTPPIEARRLAYARQGGRRWKRFKRSVNKRTGWFDDARYHGWQIQQVLKLQVPTRLQHEVYVSFDSDIVVAAPFSAQDFVRDDRVVLYERPVVVRDGAKPNRWYTNACRLIGHPQPVAGGTVHYDYVAQPFVFEKRVILLLQAWLEQRYRRPWWESLFAEPLGAWSEFMIYGAFLRHQLAHAGVFTEVANDNNVWLETETQRQQAVDVIREAFDNPLKKFLVLQADHHERWPVGRFAPLVRSELTRVTGWRPAAV